MAWWLCVGWPRIAGLDDLPTGAPLDSTNTTPTSAAATAAVAGAAAKADGAATMPTQRNRKVVVTTGEPVAAISMPPLPLPPPVAGVSHVSMPAAAAVDLPVAMPTAPPFDFAGQRRIAPCAFSRALSSIDGVCCVCCVCCVLCMVHCADVGLAVLAIARCSSSGRLFGRAAEGHCHSWSVEGVVANAWRPFDRCSLRCAKPPIFTSIVIVRRRCRWCRRHASGCCERHRW